MEKFQVDSKNDIAQEKYQGPGPVVEAAGRGSIEHLLFGLGGLIGVGGLAYIFHGPTTKVIEGARNLAKNLKTPRGVEGELFGRVETARKGLSYGFGNFLHAIFGNVEAAESLKDIRLSVAPENRKWFDGIAMNKGHGFGNWLMSHTVGLFPYVKNSMLELEYDSRGANAITLGGVAGALGYASGWGKAILLGAHHGNRGKRQFELAKAEIKDLRERNDDLEHINDKLHEDYRVAATNLHQIRSGEEKHTPPKFGEDAPASVTPFESADERALEKAMTEVTERVDHPQHAAHPAAAKIATHEAEHHGKLHANQHERAPAGVA